MPEVMCVSAQKIASSSGILFRYSLVFTKIAGDSILGVQHEEVSRSAIDVLNSELLTANRVSAAQTSSSSSAHLLAEAP